MKKITFAFLILFVLSFNVNAQDTCATAITITPGTTTTVAAVDGTEIPLPECAENAGGARTAGEWYMFTATMNGLGNVTTDLLVNAGGDTRVHIYTGACGTLTCHAGNDDVDGTNFLSNVSFPIIVGTTYYIAFDDRWDAGGFDFDLSESVYSCPTSFPYADDFTDNLRYQVCYLNEDANADGTGWTYNNVNDLDADGTNDVIINVFPPDPTVAKDDWFYTAGLTGTANADYNITLVYNSVNVRGTANETFEIVALDAPSSSAATQTVLGSYNGIVQSGVFGDTGGNDLITQAYSSSVTYTPTADGVFYIGIHATTPIADSDVFFLLSLSVDETLGVDEFQLHDFNYFYSNDTNVLTLKSSNSSFENIEIFNILGQQVINERLSQTLETINMSNLKDGIYLAKVTIEGKTQTIKLIKN